MVRSRQPDLIAYVPSKAALEALVDLLAAGLGPREVTVNAVLPGATETDMNQMAASPERVVAVTTNVGLCRVFQPADVANIVMFLVGKHGRWLTGQRTNASGGQRL